MVLDKQFDDWHGYNTPTDGWRRQLHQSQHDEYVIVRHRRGHGLTNTKLTNLPKCV